MTGVLQGLLTFFEIFVSSLWWCVNVEQSPKHEHMINRARWSKTLFHFFDHWIWLTRVGYGSDLLSYMKGSRNKGCQNDPEQWVGLSLLKYSSIPNPRSLHSLMLHNLQWQWANQQQPTTNQHKIPQSHMPLGLRICTINLVGLKKKTKNHICVLLGVDSLLASSSHGFESVSQLHFTF